MIVLLVLLVGLICGFVLGNIWAWCKEDQEYRERRKEQGLDA